MKKIFFVIFSIIFSLNLFSEVFSGWRTYDKKEDLELANYNEMDDIVNPNLSIDIFSNGPNKKSSIEFIGESGEVYFDSFLTISGYRESTDYDYSDVLFLYVYLDSKLIGAYTIGTGRHDIYSTDYTEHDHLLKDIREPIIISMYFGGDNGHDLLKHLVKAKSTSTAEFIVKDYKNTVILKHSIKCLGLSNAIKKSAKLSGNDEWQYQLGVE